MPHTSVSISIKQAAISALGIFQTIAKISLNVFKFVKEFEKKNKACFFASPTCPLNYEYDNFSDSKNYE